MESSTAKLNREKVKFEKNAKPKSNGMPELHRLTPPLGVLQKLGYKTALVTDGRMSGASGKVLAAIHVSPECLAGGDLAKIRDGDIIELDAKQGILTAHVDPAEWAARDAVAITVDPEPLAMGRYLFAGARSIVTTAEEGGSFVTAPIA